MCSVKCVLCQNVESFRNKENSDYKYCTYLQIPGYLFSLLLLVYVNSKIVVRRKFFIFLTITDSWYLRNKFQNQNEHFPNLLAITWALSSKAYFKKSNIKAIESAVHIIKCNLLWKQSSFSFVTVSQRNLLLKNNNHFGSSSEKIL